MLNHVIIVSHPRSGTHLLIDTILNDFQMFKKPYLNLDRLTTRHERSIPLDMFIKHLNAGSRVIKTHCSGDMANYFENDQKKVQFVKRLMNSSKIIYVIRDGRDVLTSLLYFMQQCDSIYTKISFRDFLHKNNTYDVYPGQMVLNPIEYWKYHVQNWINNPDVLIIKFEDLRAGYKNSLVKIAEFIDKKPDKLTFNAIRRDQVAFQSPFKRRFWGGLCTIYRRLIKMKYDSSIYYRKGEVGDYKNHFSPEDLRYFNSIAEDLLLELNYEYSGHFPKKS